MDRTDSTPRRTECPHCGPGPHLMIGLRQATLGNEEWVVDEEWCPKCGWEATATAPRAGTLHVDFDRTLEVTFASPPPLAQVAALRRVWPDAARTPVRQLLERLRAQPRIELSGMTYEQARGVRRELEDAGLRCTIVARDR